VKIFFLLPLRWRTLALLKTYHSRFHARGM
jgi:hypothetical protein